MPEGILSHLRWPVTRRPVNLFLLMAAVVSCRDIASAQSSASSDNPPVVNTVRVKLLCDRNDTIDAVVNLLSRQIEQRCEAKVKTFGQAESSIELALSEGIGKEGFRIENGDAGAVRIVGNDARGLVYGVGKLLRTSRYDRGGFTPSLWRGTSVPQKELRGMYLSTHFHNFYHDAPIVELDRYVEDLILWGMNSVVVWYDMHHFKGFDDPRAADLRNRIRHIFQTATRLGADVGFVVIANEGYGNSPPDLRRDGAGLRTRAFITDICPSKPGGIEYTLGNFRRLFGDCSIIGAAIRPPVRERCSVCVVRQRSGARWSRCMSRAIRWRMCSAVRTE